MPRDFKKEYERYQGTPEQIKRRSSRNKARRKMIAEGKARVGDGKDVAHKNGNPLENNASNLKIESKKTNRSYPRTKTARKKNKFD